MATVSIGSCISAGIDGLKKNFITHVVATVLLLVINSFTFSVLWGPLSAGYMKLARIEDEGGTPSIGDVFKGFDDFVPALVAGILGLVIIGVGFMLCIIPGLLLAPISPIAIYLVATGEKDGVKAISRAFGIWKENIVALVLTSLILGIIGSLGAILCGVGVLLTMPIAFIGLYHMAKQAVGASPANA